ncbi:MAG: phosphatidylserine decarboxylase [Planctomycetota bacterium]|jgi:phosphatidylserine decarboxylase
MLPLATYGTKEIALSFVAAAAGAAAALWLGHAAIGWAWGGALAGVMVLLFLYVLWFFRDFERTLPAEPGLVSPADGTVTHVETVEEAEYIGGRALRISIFLSIFNCHVNRMPCDATVRWVDHREGKFLDARNPDSAVENESAWVGLDTALGKVLLKQISGAIARRIVCPVAAGDTFTRGQRFGMIKFGSRTDLYLPESAGYEAAVRVGDKVLCGSTLIARAAGVPAEAEVAS